MALSRRYSPSWPPGEAATVGMDFSDVIPNLAQIVQGSLDVRVNTNPTTPTNDFTLGDITINGRQVWCEIAGGVEATDYQFRWTVSDNRRHTWNRTALLLCAESS